MHIVKDARPSVTCCRDISKKPCTCNFLLQVRGMEHRQKREAEAEEQRRARQAELDAQERERVAAKRLEQDAFERQLQVRLLTQHSSGGSGLNLQLPLAWTLPRTDLVTVRDCTSVKEVAAARGALPDACLCHAEPAAQSGKDGGSMGAVAHHYRSRDARGGHRLH